MTHQELVSKTNLAINELVHEKTHLRKAYNYYNCKRDKEQFKYLEENFGIGQPTAIEFIPLIRKHVDALVGEYLDLPIKPTVSCKDSETINNIFRDKQIKIKSEIVKFLESHLNNSLLRFIDNKQPQDTNIAEQIGKLKESVNESFVSEYEKAGQNIVQYLLQARSVDFTNKIRQLFVDLLVTGYAFYRVINIGSNIQIEALNPLNVFPDYNYNSPYIKDCSRIVVRTFLNRNQILNKYGKYLSKEDLKKIEDMWREYLETSNSYIVRSFEGAAGTPMTDGIRAGEEVVPDFPESNWLRYDNQLIPVYEVEWVETDKDFNLQRYKTVRIGQEIYILYGRDDTAIRSKDDPSFCTLSVNGVYFNNRGSRPYSLVMACMSIQDKYDITCFYRDKLIANSGSVGDWVNMPTIPAFLGKEMPERIMKWLAYKKQGIGIIDTSQEGQLNTGQAPINTMFGGFDDTVKVQAIQALELVLQSLESTASSITGVFRERLNGIQQRDAVTNVQVGINNSFIVTKQWHFQMDLLVQESLLDALNIARIAYKNGLTGTLILGEHQQKVFTALPEYYTLTDFDIHITTSTDVMREMEQIKTLVPNFVSAGIVSADIIVDMLTSKSLSEMKSKVQSSIKKQKAENNQLQQLVQQNEELQNTLKQMQTQMQQAQAKIENLNETRLQLEQQKMKLEYEIKSYEAKTDRDYKEGRIEVDNKRTEIELAQLYDGNPYNDKIKEVI